MSQQFNIEVIDVDLTDVMKKNGKGTYEVLTVTHKTSEGKVEAKKLMGFATPKEVFETLKSAKKGDTFAISREKGDAGYWEWTEVARQDMPVNKPIPSPMKGNYETSEERAARQVFIIKQSSIASAVELLKAKPGVSADDVLKVAAQFVDYVLGQRVQDMSDDVPEEVI